MSEEAKKHARDIVAMLALSYRHAKREADSRLELRRVYEAAKDMLENL